MRNKIMQLASRLLAVLLVSALLISVVPVYSFAAETDSDPVIMVSLGDSYSSGEGIEPFYGQNATTYEKVKDDDWLAHRSEKSWPSLLEIPNSDGTTSGKMKNYRVMNDTVPSEEYQWFFGAVSGAETKHFKSEQQVKAYKKKVFQQTGRPRYVSGSKSLPLQLNIFDQIDGEVDYVTLTIGGNDVDFTGIITTCVLQPDSLFSGNNGTAWFLDNKFNKLRDEIDGYLSDIRQVYLNIAAKAPQAEIIVAGYPKLLSPEGNSKVITRDEAEIVNTNVSWFNGKIKGVIGELDNTKNIHFVDVEPEFDQDGGHQAYSSDPWINPIWAGAKDQDINDLAFSSSYSIHPNEKGAKAYARCVNEKIRQIEEEKAKNGILSGKIVKASDRTTPVTTATVNVVKGNSTTTFQPGSDGTYSRELPVGTHYVKVVADGYIEFNAYADIEENQTVYMETFLMVEGEEGEIGTSTGTISNALTGNGVEDVKIDVRSGWNNTDIGEILTTVTTNSSGEYMVTLPIGNYTLSASKDGYVSTSINIVVQPNICTITNGSITPNISGDNYRVVLTWGENPRDLDSHVVGNLSNGNSFHVYFGYKSQYDGDVEVCNLDYDDTTSYGPETITLNATTNNPYYYYIYRFAGSGTVASSGAQVNVYQGDNKIATFNVPTNLGSGDYWNVFAIVDGELVVRNTMTSYAETSYAGSNISTFSLRAPRVEAHPVYDDSYPAKEEANIDEANPTEDTSITTETPDESTDNAAEPSTEGESVTGADTTETTEEPPVTSEEDLSVDTEASALQVETRKIYLSLGQVDQEYTWKAEVLDAEYALKEETEDIYSVELPVDTETMILHGNGEDEAEISSVEILLDDIQDNNCIVALNCEEDKDAFEIVWGIYDPETEEVAIDGEENLLTIGEAAEATDVTEQTDSPSETTVSEETEMTEETEDEDETDKDASKIPEEADVVS